MGGKQPSWLKDVRTVGISASEMGVFWYRKRSISHLEPQTTIYKWMFGETTISYVKIWNHPIETTIYKWLFGVPAGGAFFVDQMCLMLQKISQVHLRLVVACTFGGKHSCESVSPPHQTKRFKCPNPKISELQTCSFLSKAKR